MIAFDDFSGSGSSGGIADEPVAVFIKYGLGNGVQVGFTEAVATRGTASRSRFTAPVFDRFTASTFTFLFAEAITTPTEVHGR
jgi:hypothetical protein